MMMMIMMIMMIMMNVMIMTRCGLSSAISLVLVSVVCFSSFVSVTPVEQCRNCLGFGLPALQGALIMMMR